MRTWNEKLRQVTESLLTVVTELHKKCENTTAIRLVNSISDITQLLEQLNSDHRVLESELRREKQKSGKVLARVEVLEGLYRELERERSMGADKESREASVNSHGPSDDHVIPDDKVHRGEPESGSQKFDENRVERDEPKALSPPKSPPRTPLWPSSPLVKASISPYRPPPPKELPALPTLEEIQAEQRQRRSHKRALAAQKPPPCEKCRIRKRAMMLRQHGYVKEDVFMRWSRRPGACLQFMHYDEPVAEGVGSELDFRETETQSPKE